MADIILTKVVGGVAAGIGLVSEGISAKKKQKEAKKLAAVKSRNAGEGSSSTARSVDTGKSPDTPKSIEAAQGDHDDIPSDAPPTYDEALEEHDDEQWDLDDAQYDLKYHFSDEPRDPRTPPAAYEPESSAAADKPIRNVHKLTDAFMAKHPVPEFISEVDRMGLPVVLPQRRPKDRHRGFIRAYAPVLETKGVDQETFLEFIETFDKASQASPWIQAINLANFATIPLAPPFSFLVSIAIKMAVDTATELHSRRRTNTFLDRANAEFFQPRGLFCLVMTWNPESGQPTDIIDITSTISSRVTAQSSSSRMHRITDQFSSSNGNYGDIEFPEVAPLVFPALDQLADQTGEEAATKMAKLKKAKNFTSEYFDRRAVAKYARQNPDSVLAAQAGPKPTFTSRYADPNHPAASGNLISLVTGGHVNPPQGFGRGMGGRRGLGGALGGRMDMYERNMYGRDMYGRDMYGMEIYGRDMYGRDMYGKDPYGYRGRPGFGGLGGGLGGGFGGRRGGLENTGMGMLIGSIMDHRSRSRTADPPPLQQRGFPDEKRVSQDDRYYMQQQEQAAMMGPSRGGMVPPQRGGPLGGYGPGRGGAMDNPIAMLNPIMGIKRILKQRVLYLMIVDMPTDEQLAAATQELRQRG